MTAKTRRSTLLSNGRVMAGNRSVRSSTGVKVTTQVAIVSERIARTSRATQVTRGSKPAFRQARTSR